MRDLEKHKKIISYANDNGDNEAAKQFKIEVTTVKRYRRRLKEYGVPVGNYTNPKILLFDLETSPREYYTWRSGKQYVNPDRMIKDSAILTYSAKWLCETDIISEYVGLDEAHYRKDARITKKLWKLLDKADVIIAHNLKRFDEPYAKTRFIVNNMQPPSPYRRIDTNQTIRRQFKFPSNSQDFLTKKFGINEKLNTNFELWERCINYDMDALAEMLRYNRQDVRGLEDLYFRIRPWIKNHPNLALYYEDVNDRCPNCGSKDLKFKGEYCTNVNTYDALRCVACGAYMRSRHTNLHEEDKRFLRRSVAR